MLALRQIHRLRWGLALLLALGALLLHETAIHVSAETIPVSCDASELVNGHHDRQQQWGSGCSDPGGRLHLWSDGEQSDRPDGYGPVGLPPIVSP
jgi:hypothetical protein